MQIVRHALLSPAPGTQRELVSLHYGQAGGQKAYVQASLHGDELPGMLVAHHLRQQLDALEAAGRISGEIVLVPMANPIGLSQFLLHAHLGRFELMSGENFNRHYPDHVDAVAASVEPQLGADAAANVAILRRALKAAVLATPVDTELQSLRRTLMGLSCDADIVLDLHCDAQAVMHLYAETPCWPDCEPLARFLGARLTLLAQDSGDSPFDEACSRVWWKWGRHFGGRFPIPQACLSATVELRGATDVTHELAAADAGNIVDFLRWRGLISGDRPALPGAVGDARPLAGSMPIQAPLPGALVFLKEIGSEVQAGDVLAHVIDPVTAQVTELKSPVDGLLFARDFLRFANAGMRVAKVAGREALRSGKLLGA
ncbi:succinylglutamate desuccinylase/aspartoacylase family protein [Pelomonas aquatica]|jgi:predicted deacylase|uniref:Succinylglutamate desuccinylase/aspartoacylase family protein n=1 Tax=Pelomonas aquatica TaxID=431058 RepID=A0A9X4LFD6_9BURK|nr:succinylglutamate desuccinylase/aspartoacylase family protein [Pelomonas aquatica]MCY4755950.1 M14 family metallopeptidase [Pelomonas aquatica]MDG0862951.1 succinylglutamate desuccinylase/aspartoacylase family protein [Pelomonas aquatica]